MHLPIWAASFEIVRSCLTIWYLRAFGVYKYWTAVRCQGSLQWQVCVTRYPRKIPSCHEYVGGGGRDGISRAICELTLPSVLIPRRLLSSALIHCTGQDQSWKNLQLSQIRAPWVRVALGLSKPRWQQITVCVNHDLTLRSYQHTAQDCQAWRLVCVCVFVRLSKSMSSIPNNLLSPSSGSSWDSLICQRSPTARPGQPFVSKPGSVLTSQWVRVAGAVNQPMSPLLKPASVTFLHFFLNCMLNSGSQNFQVAY